MATATYNGRTAAHPADDDSDDLPHIRDARQHGRMRYSLARALSMASPGARKYGVEYETSKELLNRAGKFGDGMMIPFDAPMRESFDATTGTTATGAGAIFTHLMTLADALRAKSVCVRMGARMGDFRGDRSGLVALPVKRSPSTVTWTAEGVAPAASSPMLIQQVQSTPHTAKVFTDTLRRMLKTGPSDFGQYVIDDLTTGIASAIDAAALNGPGANNQPLGLAQFPWPAFNFTSGLPSHKGLTAMRRAVAQLNVDAAGDSRMGWVSSSVGREALEQCDMSDTASTGRYCWESKSVLHPLTGEQIRLESVLGDPAISSESIPTGLSGAGLTNATPLLYGNFRHMIIQLYGAVYVLANPFSFDASGSVRYSASQDVDILFQYPGVSFMQALVVAPNP